MKYFECHPSTIFQSKHSSEAEYKLHFQFKNIKDPCGLTTYTFWRGGGGQIEYANVEYDTSSLLI